MNYKNEIRFVTTNKCNSNCIFCHNEGLEKTVMEQKITPDDYGFIVETVQRCLGIDKFVLTGGEPLLDGKAIDIVKKMKNPYNKVNVITNGFLLTKYTEIAYIVDELHISLGCLNENNFNKRTRTKGMFKNVLAGIDSVIGKRATVKLNIVMVNYENKNREHIESIIKFAKEKELGLYLIEIYPEISEYHFPFSKIAELLKKIGYTREKESGAKVLYQKTDFPDIHIVFIPCAFVDSPLVDNPESYCKANQSIYILPNLTSQPCFEKNKRISILKEVKDRDAEGLVKKIKIIRSKIGKNCPIL